MLVFVMAYPPVPETSREEIPGFLFLTSQENTPLNFSTGIGTEPKPISGAEVTVTFFMAAMPAMNMPEMKAVIKGTDKGAGMYEGQGDLGSGGMWQVTVMAMQNGRTIATRKLTVKAAGGA
jgi:YtkA-like protein